MFCRGLQTQLSGNGLKSVLSGRQEVTFSQYLDILEMLLIIYRPRYSRVQGRGEVSTLANTNEPYQRKNGYQIPNWETSDKLSNAKGRLY